MGEKVNMCKNLLGLLFAFAIFIAACSDGANAANAGVDNGASSHGKGSGGTGSSPKGSTLVDSRDGQTYRTVTIGNQTWMAENLNYETENSWCGGGSGKTEGDCSVYGRLYTRVAAVGKFKDECDYEKECNLPSGDIRGVCPQGWHVPSIDEFETLLSAVGGEDVADTKLKSATGWNDYEGESGNGTDAYSFSVLPAGYRLNDGSFRKEGNVAFFWSSTEADCDDAYYMILTRDEAYLDYNCAGDGFSVRCLKDKK